MLEIVAHIPVLSSAKFNMEPFGSGTMDEASGVSEKFSFLSTSLPPVYGERRALGFRATDRN